MEFTVILIIFFAMLTHSLVGFGSALVAMPFLVILLGGDIARPSFIMMGQVAGFLFMYQYRNDWRFADIKYALVGMLIGIPIGTWIANTMSEEAFMFVLGIIITSYATYALSGFKLPSMRPQWGSFFGLFSGILHSAYNVGGPPLVMYHATHEDWEVRRFKGNTQAIFFAMRFFIIFEHFRYGNITPVVLQNFALMVPTMIVALFLGSRVEKYIKQDVFRKMVLILLIIIGLTLIF